MESFFLESFFAFFEERPYSSSARCRFSGTPPGGGAGPDTTSAGASTGRLPSRDALSTVPIARSRRSGDLSLRLGGGGGSFSSSLSSKMALKNSIGRSGTIPRLSRKLSASSRTLGSRAETGPGPTPSPAAEGTGSPAGGAETGREPHAPVLYRRRSPPGTTRVDGSAATGVGSAGFGV